MTICGETSGTDHCFWVGLHSLRSEFFQNFRMTFCNAKEGSCCARGFAAALLPILKRADRNSEQHRKGRLRKPSRQSSVRNLGNFGTMKTRTNTGLHFTYRRQ